MAQVAPRVGTMVLSADGGVGQALCWELQMVHGVWCTPPARQPLSKSIHGCRVWAHLPGPGVLLVYDDFIEYWSTYYYIKGNIK